MRIWYYFLFFFVLSCKKKELYFQIEGKIYDQTFNSDASNVTVRLFVVPAGSSRKLIETTMSNEHGLYSFVTDYERIERIELEFEKENYFLENSVVNFSDLSTTEINYVDKNLLAKSWVEFRFINNAPASASDELKIFKYRGKTDCAECCPNTYSYYYGSIDTLIYCANGSNDYLSFYYWINGSQNFGRDSVYTTPFDTLQYEINY